MTSYTKLFASIVHSTVWATEKHVKVVWVTMLAIASRHGVVEASIPGLAKVSNVTIEEAEDALAVLGSPDRYSRTKDYEGRRIAEQDGGWLILNYEKHRSVKDEEEARILTRERVKRHRAAKSDGNKGNASNADVTQGNAKAKAKRLVTPVTICTPGNAPLHHPEAAPLPAPAPVGSKEGRNARASEPPPARPPTTDSKPFDGGPPSDLEAAIAHQRTKRSHVELVKASVTKAMATANSQGREVTPADVQASFASLIGEGVANLIGAPEALVIEALQRAGGGNRNPLVDREALVAEGQTLITAIVAKSGLTATEVLAKASEWNGKGYVRLEAIAGYDRLAHAVNTLRSWSRKLNGEPEPAPPRPERSRVVSGVSAVDRVEPVIEPPTEEDLRSHAEAKAEWDRQHAEPVAIEDPFA